MARYLARLRIDVEHGYYADGRARGLRFEPDGDTADWLERHDAVWRDTGDGLTLAAPTPREGAPRDAAGWLTWFARCDDRPYANVTAHLPRHGDALLHFQPPAGASTVAGAVQTLHVGTTAMPADAWPTHPPGVLAGLLTTGRRHRPPAFMLRVPAPVLDTIEAPAATVATYRIAFAARMPVWKYCLLGDWSAGPLRVEDAAQSMEFADPVAETLDNGQTALSIRSLAGIALRERSAQRFQLRSRSGEADRILVKRLPVAGADRLARETIDGVPTLVSEIFVHR